MVPVESSCRTVEPTVAVLSYTVVYCRTVILSILSNCRNTVDYCRTLLSNCRTGALCQTPDLSLQPPGKKHRVANRMHIMLGPSKYYSCIHPAPATPSDHAWYCTGIRFVNPHRGHGRRNMLLLSHCTLSFQIAPSCYWHCARQMLLAFIGNGRAGHYYWQWHDACT